MTTPQYQLVKHPLLGLFTVEEVLTPKRKTYLSTFKQLFTAMNSLLTTYLSNLYLSIGAYNFAIKKTAKRTSEDNNDNDSDNDSDGYEAKYLFYDTSLKKWKYQKDINDEYFCGRDIFFAEGISFFTFDVPSNEWRLYKCLENFKGKVNKNDFYMEVGLGNTIAVDYPKKFFIDDEISLILDFA